MDAEVLEALKKSINAWRRKVDAAHPMRVDIGATNCPLCIHFGAQDYKEPNCRLCPVMDKTGRPGCEKTPWFLAIKTLMRWRGKVRNFASEVEHAAAKEAWQEAARKEVDFLKSLLPEV